MNLELINPSLNAEVTVVQKLNQGIRKKSAVYLFFLDFLVLFYQEKSTEKSNYLKDKKVRTKDCNQVNKGFMT